MEDQERIEREDEDVEAHRKRAKAAANEEPTEEGTEEQADFELHRRRHSAQ